MYNKMRLLQLQSWLKHNKYLADRGYWNMGRKDIHYVNVKESKNSEENTAIELHFFDNPFLLPIKFLYNLFFYEVI